MKVFDICEIKMGYAFRSRIEHDPAGFFKVIQPKDISDDGALLIKDISQIGMISVKPSQLLVKNDVLLANRGRFAATVFLGDKSEGYIASGSIVILNVKPDLPVLPEYLAFYFNSKSGKRQFSRFNETTTIPFISRANLEQIDIPLPALEKQKTLVALEQSKKRYAQLTGRKLELLNGILNKQLTTAQFRKGDSK